MTNTTKQTAPTIAYRIPDLPRPPADLARLDPEPDPVPDAIATELGRSLQLSRASLLALTRLQMAIKSGDRHATMAAMDQLHALDAEMERFVERLPAPAPDDPTRGDWDALARHLADQKLSLAFEKLALVSEISGPDMVSPPPDFGPSRAVPHTEDAADASPGLPAPPEAPPPLSDWPRLPAVRPVEWTALPAWLLGLVATLLAMVAVAAAAFVLTG